MTIEGDRITHMQPLNPGEVVIDPAKLPDNIGSILPGWRLVPHKHLDAITRLALAAVLSDRLRESATELKQWVH